MNDERHCARWTPREDRKLTALCSRAGTLAEVAALMGRTPAAVRVRIAALKLNPAYHRPSFRTLDRTGLEQAVEDGTRPAEIARKLHVANGTLIRWRKQLDLPTRAFHPWTSGEVATLRKMFPSSTPPQIAGRIERTPGAIAAKARELDLKKPNAHVWTASELRSLKKLYSRLKIKQISAELGLSPAAIASMAYKLGLKKWKHLSHVDVENVRTMIDAGVPLGEIKRRTGYSAATLRSIRAGRRPADPKDAPPETNPGPNGEQSSL